jgi:hypothetical protein
VSQARHMVYYNTPMLDHVKVFVVLRCCIFCFFFLMTRGRWKTTLCIWRIFLIAGLRRGKDPIEFSTRARYLLFCFFFFFFLIFFQALLEHAWTHRSCDCVLSCSSAPETGVRVFRAAQHHRHQVSGLVHLWRGRIWRRNGRNV